MESGSSTSGFRLQLATMLKDGILPSCGSLGASVFPAEGASNGRCSTAESIRERVMPIYEYYCPVCQGRYSHLARRIGEPAPPCPRCQNTEVERLVSSANLVHQDAHHERALENESTRVRNEDAQTISSFLEESGRLDDASGVYGSEAYRELIYRRRHGAGDEDLDDLVDDLVGEMATTSETELSGVVVFSDEVENRMGAEGPPEHQEHGAEDARGAGNDSKTDSDRPQSRRSAEDLGWV